MGSVGKGPLLAAFLLLLIFLISFNFTGVGGFPSPAINDLKSLDFARIQGHVQFFSSLETRATGYAGNLMAAQYIKDRFNEYALGNVTFHNFTVLAPMDHGANLTLTQTAQTLRVYPIEPNLVCPSTTPPEGLTGDLVYVGDGHLEDLEGKHVNGNIALMNWYSEHRWLTLANLGAKAVIFLPPTQILPPAPAGSPESTKSIPIPLNFPRFYLPEPDASNLLGTLTSEGQVSATLRASTYWEKTKGINIIGLVKGTTYPEKYVMVTAYYDSGSITSSLAPGAQEASGISCLLEIARVLAASPPKYSVLFVALGAHHQDLGGAQAFAEDGFWPGTNPFLRLLAERIIIQLNLDISTGSETIYAVYFGNFYPYPLGGSSAGVFQGMEQNFDAISSIWENTVKEVNQQLPNEEGYSLIRYWGGIQLTGHGVQGDAMSWNQRNFDSEPLKMLRLPTWTFTTIYDCRPYFMTPFDTLDNVNMHNLERQLELLYILIYRTSNLDDLFSRYITQVISASGIGWGNFVPRAAPSGHSSPNPMNSFFKGTVAKWDETKAWYTPVPNAIVYIRGNTPAMGFFRKILVTDKNGTFELWGVTQFTSADISAWVIDSSTGNPTFAPDLGQHKYAPLAFSGPSPAADIGFMVVFPCSSMALFNLYSPNTLRAPEVYQEQLRMWIPVALSVRDHISQAPLTYYGTWLYRTPDEVVAIVTFPPDVPVDILVNEQADRYPLACLLNSTDEKPQGAGYRVRFNEQMILPFSALQYAEHLHRLNAERYKKLAGIDPKEVLYPSYQVHKEVEDLIQSSRVALRESGYRTYFRNSLQAWSKSREVYLYVRPKIENAAAVVPFFAVLLLPFILVTEKLLFNLQGLRKVVPYILLFLATMISLYLLHPGFSAADSPTMIIMGISNAILLSPIILIMFNHVKAILKSWRLKLLGKHEIEVTRGAAVLYAFSVGLENMRKRKLRTILVITNILLVTAAVVNLTSIETLTVSKVVQVPEGASTYLGVYIRKTGWGFGGYGLGTDILEYLRITYGDKATILPRAWKYTDYPYDSNPKKTIGFKLSYNGTVTSTPVIWGLTYNEVEATHPEVFLTANSRWFESGDSRVMIISDVGAQALGIKDLPTKVDLEGLSCVVIGIIGSEYWTVKNLEGESVTPIQFDVPMQPNPWDIHVNMDYVLILPLNDVLAMGGEVASITLLFKDASLIPSATSEISQKFPTYLIYSYAGDEIALSTAGLSVITWGFQYQAIVLGIVGMSIFNIMLGSIYERRREISIYSSVGLNPLHITIIFLAEATTYGLLGGVVGFILAMLIGRASGAFLPGLVILNYSSQWVVFAISFAIAITIASSIYPAYKASTLMTPSLERAWKISSKPVGNQWQIMLPFSVTSEEEANGMLAYLSEFVKAHMGERPPDFSAGKELRLEEGETLDKIKYKRLAFEAFLVPYGVGVRQTTAVEFNEAVEKWNLRLLLIKVAGADGDWVSLNRSFVDILRKQMLIWRSLPDQEKKEYVKKFSKEAPVK